MATKVRSVMVEAMRANGMQGYARQAEPVIAAVERAAAEAAEALRGIAIEKGLSEQEANAILVQAGLVDDAPVTGTNSGTAGVEATVNRLVQFARQHGFRG